MRKAGVLSILFVLVLLAVAVIAEAQQPTKVPRIGYLKALNPVTESDRSEPFRLALRKLGYIEGQNIAIEYRNAEGKLDRYPELAAELVRLKVDIIVTTGGTPTLAATNATKTIPIVMLSISADRECRGWASCGIHKVSDRRLPSRNDQSAARLEMAPGQEQSQ